ncbi:phosphoprotein phosphatase methylesterase 1 [Lachancea thermotolerans CBS 6340]|uniref:Protein phosphatase methylesterase 1 n=1 Tax=Lachancea thermotolerans (strain ATCC 56472 / CBS 6340 / NRRL Y-8284) TaxID=559295 RepID=C5E3N5_LACTC|nr:carboxylesterase-mitochondrial 37S ribosomal protein YmS2 [Lachancea thermotolerans CBS 6340]CAR30646.1 KLTH0H15026p [Lachancea thermotolerans CBS 6340]
MSDDLRRALLEKLGKADAQLGAASQPAPAAPAPAGLPTWHDFFQQNARVQIGDRGLDFNTYFSLPAASELADPSNTTSVPIFIFHHGAGSSGLSFAPLAKALHEQLDGRCGSFAFDARGHGLTAPVDAAAHPADYSLDAFVRDFRELIAWFHHTHLQALPASPTFTLVITGHSLGGSICTNVFPSLDPALRTKVAGLAMLDIVEEAAILALSKVDSFLSNTPNVFPSYANAIDWHVKRGLSRLRSSAEIVVPSLFVPTSSGKVVRRTNLQIFKPFWDTWFQSLSRRFVALPTSKLLILAGNDNLDRELMIGQMQGKFQLVVFQESGHFIEEDAPVKTAITLVDFWRRNDTKSVVIKTNWTKKANT